MILFSLNPLDLLLTRVSKLPDAMPGSTSDASDSHLGIALPNRDAVITSANM